MDFGVDSNLAAGALLVGDVGLGGGVIPDNDGGETGQDALRLEFGHIARDLFTNVRGDLAAIDDARGHGRSPCLSAMK